MTNSADNKYTLSVEGAAAQLQLSVARIRKIIQQERIRTIKVTLDGTKIQVLRLHEEDVLNYTKKGASTKQYLIDLDLEQYELLQQLLIEHKLQDVNLRQRFIKSNETTTEE